MPVLDLKKLVVDALSSLEKDLSSDPCDFIELLIFNHSCKLAATLKDILCIEDEEALKQSLTQFLAENWQQYGMSALGYTAQPSAPTTKLMCELACLLADEHTSAFKLLMPGVSTEPTNLIDYPDFATCKSMDALTRILNCHILGRDGKCLIPVSLLYKQKNLSECIDKLPITKKLLEQTGTVLTFTEPQNTAMLVNMLSVEDISVLFNIDDTQRSFFRMINTIELASFFIINVSILALREILNTPCKSKLIQLMLNGNFLDDTDDGMEEFVRLLSMLDEEKQAAIIQTLMSKDFKDIRHELLVKSVNEQSVLKLMLEEIPKNERLAAVIDVQNNRTLFHWAISNTESLKVILQLLSEDERVIAVHVKVDYGYTALHLADIYPESLKEMLSALPESERLAAVQEKDNDGCSVLQRATGDPQSLKAILSLLPENHCLLAAQEKNHTGDTLLHFASDNLENLKAILSMLPEGERLSVVQQKNIHGYTVLHVARYDAENIKAILSLLPESDRTLAVQEKDINGYTVLHLAVDTPESFEVILNLLPVNNRLAAIHDKTNNGVTVLDLASRNPSCLKLILRCLSEEEHFGLLKSMNYKDELRNSLITEHDSNLAGQPVLIICKYLLLKEKQQKPSWFFSSQTWPSLDNFLLHCDDYHSFFINAYSLLQKNYGEGGEELLEQLQVEGADNYETRLQALAERWLDFGVSYHSTDNREFCAIL